MAKSVKKIPFRLDADDLDQIKKAMEAAVPWGAIAEYLHEILESCSCELSLMEDVPQIYIRQPFDIGNEFSHSFDFSLDFNEDEDLEPQIANIDKLIADLGKAREKLVSAEKLSRSCAPDSPVTDAPSSDQTLPSS